MALNLGPGHRKIRCPSCGNGTIRMATGTRALECSNLKWTHDGFSGGHCTFTTRDFGSIPLEPGERLVIRDFSPFAFTDGTARSTAAAATNGTGTAAPFQDCKETHMTSGQVDAGPHDEQGWKLHDDGSRVHRYTCTIHDGDGCDGHCGPHRPR